MPNRLDSLNQLASAVPGLNKEAQRQSQAARDIMLQRQLRTAPTTDAASQQLAVQQAQVAGQQEVGLLAQQQQQLQQVGRLGLQQQALTEQEKLGKREIVQREEIESSRQQQASEISQRQLESRKRISDKEIQASEELQNFGIYQDNSLQLATLKQREDLANVGRDVKNKILDSRIRFSADERGRKFTNKRQLDDYILSNAKTEQEFNTHMRATENMAKKNVMLMEHASARLRQIIKQGFISNQGDLDREQKQELIRIQQENQARIARERAKAKAHRGKWVAGGQIIGAVVGAVFGGGPVGAAVGSSIGGAVGAVAAESTS